MSNPSANLNGSDLDAFSAALAFLKGRLRERATLNWAVRAGPNDPVMRSALLETLDRAGPGDIPEPWLSAWRLIEEYWHNPPARGSSVGPYDAQHRLESGDRSRSLVAYIVELVRPHLKLEPPSDTFVGDRKPLGRPRSVGDLLRIGLTSGRVIDPEVLGLGSLDDGPFLRSLALMLDATVADTLDLARRIGWHDEHQLWRLGWLHRVSYIPVGSRGSENHEPDAFHEGIAPSVKLLHEVVTRLVDVDLPSALDFAGQWKLTRNSVHMRLWAALARDSRVAPPDEVGAWLLSLDNGCFWDLHEYPEIAELRARRFGDLGHDDQTVLTGRIRRGPPRSHWTGNMDAGQVKSGKLYWAIRELRRIEIGGGFLPEKDKIWADMRCGQFPELIEMTELDEGFLDTHKAFFVPPNPDKRYDSITGEDRLEALEKALGSSIRSWDDEPSRRAADWISQGQNSLRLLVDLESSATAGAAYPKVWDRFGWTHAPDRRESGELAERDLPAESARVLALLNRLSASTLRQAIEGLSHWLSHWARSILGQPEALEFWFKAWSHAVEATNARQMTTEIDQLNTVGHRADGQEPMDLDTLNTPTGKLVGAFLAFCPDMSKTDAPFADDTQVRRMRDAIADATGVSLLIAQHRMIEHLRYFLLADPDWSLQYLVTPLQADNAQATALWRAVGRRIRSTDELKAVGFMMTERALDARLGRESRSAFASSLVFECLFAFMDQREPAVPAANVQQMIRLLDDEVRGSAASAIHEFVRDVPGRGPAEADAVSPATLFRSAAVPFLRTVWPQELSLSTPGVSEALAQLPSVAKEAFAEAVDAVERFLVPFDCWTLDAYGFRSRGGEGPALSSIDDHEKAAALLRLLGSTIGTESRSVVPHDLSRALDQILKEGPHLAKDPVFRRLATLARRR